jgi:zinc transporter, ZIP family
MASSLANVLGFASIPAVAVVLGGVFASLRTPSPAVRSGVQHLAAGVLFAALAVELLPDVIHRRLPWVTLIGFSLGVLTMLALKAATGKLEPVEDRSGASVVPMSLLLVSSVDIALDGLLIGISFSASERQGFLVTAALTLEVLFLGVAAAASITGEGSRRRILWITSSFGALLLGGAALGAYFLTGVDGVVLDVVMSFAVAALLYLVTEELLTEAHEEDETPLLTSMFFVGFVTLLTIEMLV